MTLPLERFEATAYDEDMPLVRAAAAGDRNAFGALYERHRQVVLARLSRLSASRNDVEDLAQETFLRASRALHGYRGDGPFRAWLLRIATHTAHENHRRSRRSIWRVFTEPDEERQLQGAKNSDAEACADRFALSAALAQLPAQLREAVIRFELRGETLVEIADAHGESVNTIAARVRRGRDALRRVLSRGRLAILAVLFVGALLPVARAWISPVPQLLVPDSSIEAPARSRQMPPRHAIPVVRRSSRTARSAQRGPAAAQSSAAFQPGGDYIEPEGDVIFVKPLIPRPPLFTTKEYKSRGVLEQPN